MSWDERNLIEEAIKMEINKIRAALEIVYGQLEQNESLKKATKRYEMKLKFELADIVTDFIDLIGQSSE